jgi:hypothetical protein
MADSNLLTKSGLALSAYLTSAGVTATIVSGEGNTDKVLPLVSCIADSAATIEGQEFTGNRAVTATVEVRSIAADDAGEHASLAQQVGDALNSDTLAADLTAALDGFTCIGAVNQGEDLSTDGDTWLSSFKLTMWACPSDLSA